MIYMIIEEIRQELFKLRDEGYRDLQIKLLPTVSAEAILGVRTPQLRELAKGLCGRADINAFLDELPHKYFDENQLHAFIIARIRDYGDCLRAVERFLPYIDNWATCDQLSPAVFGRHKAELLEPIRGWIASSAAYTVRFGVKLLMEHYLDDNFEPEYLEMVAALRSDEYYVNMMLAWYFATALAKQYDAAVPYIEERKLAQWTHNKAIQKALESRRVSLEHKDYLRGLRL